LGYNPVGVGDRRGVSPLIKVRKLEDQLPVTVSGVSESWSIPGLVEDDEEIVVILHERVERPAFSRKNSGKKREKRVRLTRCSSSGGAFAILTFVYNATVRC
jgi:hypothetical protein